MEEKIVIVLNEMSEYLSITQMKQLQEVIIKTFADNEVSKVEISNEEFLEMFLDAKRIEGVIWIVDGSNDFYFKDGNLIRVDASEKFDSVYMKNLLENLIDDYKKQMSTGTTYNALTISGLTKLKVYDVPIELQNLFSEFVNQVYKSKVVA